MSPPRRATSPAAARGSPARRSSSTRRQYRIIGPMRRILVVGTGGVGAAIGMIARHRGFFERMVLADVDGGRAAAAARKTNDDRFGHAALDASDPGAIVALTQAEKADVVVNACDPRLNPPIFQAAVTAGVPYLDMAMTLSQPH